MAGPGRLAAVVAGLKALAGPGSLGAMRPVVVFSAQGQQRPIVVEVPHAGLAVPDEVRPELALDADGVRRDADLYVDRLYRQATALGATLIFSEVSRFVVDLNRDPDDVDAASVPAHPRPQREAQRGLIWRVTTDGVAALTAPLSLDSWQRRVARYHAPYHRALDEELSRVRARFGKVVLLSGHSMPSVGKATHADPGQRRADVVPGDLLGAACDPRVTAACVDLFRGAGHSVAVNQPYKGGGTTRRHGRPAEGVHALQVELNRDLYMDEVTFSIKEPAFTHLEELCLELVDRLAAVAEAL